MNRRGMSLIELLVVMAIIALLAAVAVPALSTIAQGTNVTRSADLLEGTLRAARQTALTKNRQVEVRFYSYVDPEAPGLAEEDFLAVQTFLIEESGIATPLAKVDRLPQGILLDSSKALSPILAESSLARKWTTLIPQPSLPRIGTSYGCQAFRFRPDGSTSLPPSTSWFLTLHGINDGDNLSQPPANYATIQIDPVSGSLTTYRP